MTSKSRAELAKRLERAALPVAEIEIAANANRPAPSDHRPNTARTKSSGDRRENGMIERER